MHVKVAHTESFTESVPLVRTFVYKAKGGREGGRENAVGSAQLGHVDRALLR